MMTYDVGALDQLRRTRCAFDLDQEDHLELLRLWIVSELKAYERM
jgi:hypothetical protein